MSDMEVTEGRLLSQAFEAGGPPAAVEVPPPPRTVETVTLEIRILQHQAQGIILNYAIEIGRRLEEAKAMLTHGEWGAWLKSELDFSQSTANNFMRIFREYGAAQQSLFGGEAKSQSLANLTYTKALRLLAIPDEEERERFIAGHDVEGMSSRELERAIRERDEARMAAEAAKADAQAAEDSRAQMAADMEDLKSIHRAAQEGEAQARQELETVRAELQALRDKPVDVAVEVDKEAVEAARKAAIAEMEEKVDKANKAAKEAKAVRKDAEAALAAAQKELAELRAKGLEARELTQEEKDALTAEAVERAREEDAGRIRGLEKKLAAADPNVAELMVRFTSWQEEYQKLMEILGRIDQDDAERAAKLRQGVKTALEQMELQVLALSAPTVKRNMEG